MSKFVETFPAVDGLSDTLILAKVPNPDGTVTEHWLSPEEARILVLELFDAYLSVT